MKLSRLTAPERSLIAQYDIDAWMSSDPPPWDRETYFTQIDGVRSMLGVKAQDPGRPDDPSWICKFFALLLAEDEDFMRHVVDDLEQNVTEEAWEKLCLTAAIYILNAYVREVSDGSWEPQSGVDVSA